MVWRLTRTYRWVRNRIDELEPILLPSERFILVFGFVEKIVRRTFIHICAKNGTSEEDAVADSKKSDLMKLNGKWRRETGQTLREVIGRDAWARLHHAAELRNELIHGRGHRNQHIYKEMVDGLLRMIDAVSAPFGFGGAGSDSIAGVRSGNST